jgi:hypothetical protein
MFAENFGLHLSYCRLAGSMTPYFVSTDTSYDSLWIEFGFGDIGHKIATLLNDPFFYSQSGCNSLQTNTPHCIFGAIYSPVSFWPSKFVQI